jgi:hypothetical protein
VKRVPKWMQGVLWSISVNKVDLDKDKYYVVTQSLNYGSEKILSWLFKNYSQDEIVSVITNPIRGVWNARILNYWQKKLGVEIPLDKFQKAIKRLYDEKNDKNILANN